MTNDYLREADRKVTEHLQGLFGFEGHMHKLYDARDPEGREFIRRLEAELGHPISHDFLHSDVLSIQEMEGEYSIIMLNTERECYPLHLGNEMTHCEHMLAHKKAERMVDYECRFNRAFRSMLGTLGMYSVYESLFEPEERPKFWTSRPGRGSVISTQNYVGFQLAMQLVSSGKEIPYNDLFWAIDHKNGMKIFTCIAKPLLVLIDEEIKPDIRAEIIGSLVEMDLDMNVLSL